MKLWSKAEVKKSVLVHTAKNPDGKINDEEEKYYLLLKKYARILAPFYDTVFGSLSLGAESKLRDKVVDFANVRNRSRILDVATGTGRQAFAFAKRGYDVVGIDLSEDMLKVAIKKNKYENVKFEIVDATNLPFEDNRFDVSCVSFALHDMILTIREKALKEMVRVTKPKGTIVIVDYALPKNKVSRFFIYHLVKLYEPYYPEFIKSDLEALLRKSGIEIEEELPVLLGAGKIIKGTPEVAAGAEDKSEEENLARQVKTGIQSAIYIPAFGHNFLTPFYDFMMKWAARESTFKPKLVEQTRIEKGLRVLDLGCGTATLTILIKKTHPEAEVVGLDADSKILEIAKSKVAETGLDITLDHGTAFKLPYPDSSFGCVVSSMVFHHLTRENKVRSLREVFRVLKSGGELHVADLGKPQNALMQLASVIFGRLEETSENIKGLLPEMFRNAGFEQVEETT